MHFLSTFYRLQCSCRTSNMIVCAPWQCYWGTSCSNILYGSLWCWLHNILVATPFCKNHSKKTKCKCKYNCSCSRCLNMCFKRRRTFSQNVSKQSWLLECWTPCHSLYVLPSLLSGNVLFGVTCAVLCKVCCLSCESVECFVL